MAKYLIQASYTTEGIKGLVKDGGSKRRAVVEETLKGLGGKVEAFYYAFGDSDVVAIFDLPDNASATAVALTVAATGAVNLKTTVLISAEEVDQATKKTVRYRPPGQSS
jgi:uncharacterized protein with GYD domain